MGTKGQRADVLEEIGKDPFIGYSSVQEAQDDCKGSSQVEVMCRLLNRENLFVSGPAGSGKTTVVKRFIDFLDAAYDGCFNVAVTATTGLAATLIDGRTIHSWSGLGVLDEAVDSRGLAKLKTGWKAYEDIKYADVLVVDEISMLHAYYLDALDLQMKKVRRSDEPFGGVQVVLLGDFMQLPPVPPRDPKPGTNYGFAAQSQAWREARFRCCFLDKVHRAEDEELRHLLRGIERGSVDERGFSLLERCASNRRDPEKVYATLFTRNLNVDRYNEKKLEENVNPPRTYTVEPVFGDDDALTRLRKARNIPEKITLKRGATVIVTRNFTDESGLLVPNGSIGKVVSMDTVSVKVALNDGRVTTVVHAQAEEVKKVSVKDKEGNVTQEEKPVAVLDYIPLKLGYAITVHKSQGQTFDGVEVDLSNCFSPGLGYVALSRVRSSDNLIVSRISDNALEVSPVSRAITQVVKRSALVNRREFMDSQDEYTSLLTDSEARDRKWDLEQSGARRKARDKSRPAV